MAATTLDEVVKQVATDVLKHMSKHVGETMTRGTPLPTLISPPTKDPVAKAVCEMVKDAIDEEATCIAKKKHMRKKQREWQRKSRAKKAADLAKKAADEILTR